MLKHKKISVGLWMCIGVIVILGIVYFPKVLQGAGIIISAFQSLLIGAAFAFMLNLVMEPIQLFLEKRKNKFLVKNASGLALLASFIVVTLIIAAIITLVVPNLIEAGHVLMKSIPQYSDNVHQFLTTLFKNYPDLAVELSKADLNWNEVVSRINQFLTKGFGGILDSTFSILVSIVNSIVNLFIIIVFAIYILTDKERFVRMYYFFTKLYLTQENADKLTRSLRTINKTFKAFVGGECIEAVILTVMCLAGMLILRMPYAMMISILVGVINMIPMVGAFIGGGIGVFLIFTVSPVKAVIFLVFLCIIQQIESNVFFPRIIGKNVGLPGIYVMMTIVVGGTLFGVMGMLLGVPVVASIYKLLVRYYEGLAQKRQVMHHGLAVQSTESKPEGLSRHAAGASRPDKSK